MSSCLLWAVSVVFGVYDGLAFNMKRIESMEEQMPAGMPVIGKIVALGKSQSLYPMLAI